MVVGMDPAKRTRDLAEVAARGSERPQGIAGFIAEDPVNDFPDYRRSQDPAFN